MAWCHQATSHYLSQCWPRSLSPYGITWPQCVKWVAAIWLSGIDLARNGNSGCANQILGCANATFHQNPHEIERIWVILGCAISSIAHAKHGCTGGWLKLCSQVGYLNSSPNNGEQGDIPPFDKSPSFSICSGIHDTEERCKCLSQAEDAGLDVSSITKQVVENIRSRDHTEFSIDLEQQLDTAISEVRITVLFVMW